MKHLAKYHYWLLCVFFLIIALNPVLVLGESASPVSQTVLFTPDSDSHASGSGSGFPTISYPIDNFTIEGYAYLPLNPSSEEQLAIFSKKQFAELTVYLDNGYSPDVYVFEFKIYTSSTEYSFIRWATYYYNVDREWNHIAVTYNSSSSLATLYLNGNMHTSVLNSGTGSYFQSPPTTINIGGIESYGFSWFDYYLDEVRVSDTVRYTTNFTPLTSPFSVDGSTVGLWHFDESPGSTSFSDSSSNTLTLNAANDAITVLFIPSITITSPNGGESWTAGTDQSLTWTSQNLTGTVTLELYKNSSLDSTIVSGTTNDGSCSWTIPSGQAPGNDYTVRVTSDSDGAVNDTSNNDFIISSPLTRQVLVPVYNLLLN